ncbi:MAG TPA: hypothetical protein VF047_01200 [Nitrososphaeraceae archaeon]
MGDSIIVLYGKNLNNAHMDIIGSGISIAVKITALVEAKINLFSENIFETILGIAKDIGVKKLDIVNRNWDYKIIKTNRIFNTDV